MQDDQRKAMFAKLGNEQGSRQSKTSPYQSTQLKRLGVRDSAKIDDIQLREATIQITNDGDVYRQRFKPIIESLKKKYDKGEYDREKAKIAYYCVVQDWTRQHKTDVGAMNSDTKKQLANDLEQYYREEVQFKG